MTNIMENGWMAHFYLETLALLESDSSIVKAEFWKMERLNKQLNFLLWQN